LKLYVTLITFVNNNDSNKPPTRHTVVLHDRLHWLWIKEHITYKLCLMVYKLLDLRSPAYIKSNVNPSGCNSIQTRLHGDNPDTGMWSRRSQSRRLRSSSPQVGVRIACPQVYHQYSECGFSYAGIAWNGLPSTTHLALSIESFKTEL